MLAKKDLNNKLNFFNTETITPSMAKFFLEEFKYPRQRTLIKGALARYTREMQDGNFLQPTPLIFGVLNGRKYLLDGHHRLSAQVMANVPIQYFLLYHHVKTEAELNDIYTRIDCHEPRKPKDQIKALGLFDIFGQDEISHSRIVKGGSAAVQLEAAKQTDYVIDLDSFGKKSPFASKAINDWSEEIRLYNSLIIRQTTGRSQGFWKKPIAVIALATLHFEKEKAIDFWTKLIKNDGLRSGDPCKRLNDFIVTTTLIAGRGTTQGLRHAQATPYIRTVAKCWNLFYEDKPASKLTFTEFPKAELKGTPYKVR